MLTGEVIKLIVAAALMFGVIGGLSLLAHHYTLGGIKSRTVGDGQHGTARWATKREIQKTYVHIRLKPEQWRKGKSLPKADGIIMGSTLAKRLEIKASDRFSVVGSLYFFALKQESGICGVHI